MTGQVLFRSSRQEIPTPKGGYETGKTIHMLYGIVSLPHNPFIKDHVLYPVLGQFNKKKGQLITTISLDEGEDRNDVLNGEGAGGVFRAPIWRV